MMSRLPGEIVFLKKNLIIYFLSYFALQFWPLETCNQDISKIIIARSFKLGQLIQDGEWYS